MKNSLNIAWDNFKTHFKEWQAKREAEKINQFENETKNQQDSENFIESLNKKELSRIRSLSHSRTNETNNEAFEFNDELIGSLMERLKLKKQLLSSFDLSDFIRERTKKEILEIEGQLKKKTKKEISEIENELKSKNIQQEEDKRLERKRTEELFMKSFEYVFIQKAAEKLLSGAEIDYPLIKGEIGNQWNFSTNQLFKFIENELEQIRSKIEEENKFYNSQGFKYIKQFAKKYGEKGKAEDFNQLQTLLENWQYDFSIEELKSLVTEEGKKQKIENLKNKILSDNPHNRGAILKAYLNFYRSSDEINLKILAELLEERYSAIENISNLNLELQMIEKRIELENFEKRLSEEDEQFQIEEIDSLSGYEFEDFLKTLFSKMGYEVEPTKLSGDQGADLVIAKFGEKSVIQAKRFGGKVGNKAVQEILAAISLYKAQKGSVITNSYFTPAAVELARANNIELIDRDALEELINKHW